MATYSIEKLSASVDGKGIVVAGTSAAADTPVHVAVATAGDIDLVTLWAVNNDTDGETRTLTLAWGGEAAGNLFTVPIPAGAGPVAIADRLPIMNGLTIGAWADEVDDVVIYGHVARVDK